MKDLTNKLENLSEDKINMVSTYVDKITKKTNLLPVFEEKLKTIKNNPVEEPKIAAKQKEIEAKATKGDLEPTEVLLEIVEAVYSFEEIEALEKEYNLDIKDIVRFGGAISNKVFGYKEEKDGEDIFKEIESQNSLKPVPYTKKREVRKQYQKYEAIVKKTVEYTKKDTFVEKELIDLQEEIKTEEKLLDIKVQEAHDLDTSSMSTWEKELLKQKVVANSYGNYTPPLGKK